MLCTYAGVEDLHQAEAGRASTQGGGQNRMRYFVEAEEAHRLSLAFTDKSRNQRQEPNMGLSGSNLFSHGPKPGIVFGASMANLHYKNPADCSACHPLLRRLGLYRLYRLHAHAPARTPLT